MGVRHVSETIRMTEPIVTFRGRHFFLSNFYAPAPVRILVGSRWTRCPTVEHGYQASKTLNQRWRKEIIAAPTAAEAKQYGKNVMRVSYWEEVKLVVMLELLRQKFSRTKMSDRLLRTGDAKLIEGNWWHDNFWGVCECDRCAEHCAKEQVEGNWLGRLLMRVRRDIA